MIFQCSGMPIWLFLLLPIYFSSNFCSSTQIVPINNNGTGNGGMAGEDEGEVKLDAEWACGTDDFSRFLAESTIDRDCPENKNALNNCCVKHDNCYDEQLGQKHCDDTFCSCLEMAAMGNDICTKEDVPYFCQLVRQFGEHYYNASAKLDGKSPIVPVNGDKKPNRAQRIQ